MEISRKELLRYLGFRSENQPEPPLEEALQKAEDIVRRAAKPRAVNICLNRQTLTQTGLLCGEDIRRHLSGCSQVILMAATLGSDVELEIRAAQVSDALLPVVLDACATVAVEAFCDEYCSGLSRAYEKKGLFLTGRFSPGYGDFPLEKQELLLRLTNAQRRIGLFVTESCILTPRKSITAVIGVSEHAQAGYQAGCETCRLREKCEYRKRGEFCNV